MNQKTIKYFNHFLFTLRVKIARFVRGNLKECQKKVLNPHL